MSRACLAIAVLMAACFALAISEDPVLREKRIIKSLHGRWSAWCRWSSCSKKCGGGVHIRRRICLHRSLFRRRCPGVSKQVGKCNTQKCRGDDECSSITNRCLNCICKEESKCKPLGCKMDGRSLSCEYYQIKWLYYIDCKKPGGNSKTDWKKCAKNKSCAAKCVRNYMARYSQRCAGGKPVTCETHARIHNGGPKGCKKSSTVAYWKKVKKCLNT